MTLPLQALHTTGASDGDNDILAQGKAITGILRGLFNEAREHVRSIVAPHGVIPDARMLPRFSAITHPLVWLATCVEALAALDVWAEELQNSGRFNSTECLIYRVGYAEYAHAVFNGIAMGAMETASLSAMGLRHETIDRYRAAVMAYPLVRSGGHETKAQLFETLHHFLQDTTQPLLPAWIMGDAGLSPSLRHFCRKVRTFLFEQVEPYAHAWHLADTPIPLEVKEKFSQAGLLDLSVGQGGRGYDRATVVALIEEIATSSVTLASYVRHHTLATELLSRTGTPAQKAKWLPLLNSGKTLCALTFTEMCSGALLDDLRLRAHAEGDVYRINGYKTCVSNVARADVLVVLARTPHSAQDASFFFLEKSRTTEDDPFPLTGGVAGLSGSAVRTAGHRGLGHYDLAFDGVSVPAQNLIGGIENQGRRQLIQIQEQDCLNAAAQSIGAGRAALEATLRALMEREIFDKDIDTTGREKNKIAMMVTHLMIARQLCRVTASRSQNDCRGYIKAGMAKLLAARIAWLSADVALQMHGGAGSNLENPISRLWVDARTTGLLECPAEFVCQRLLENNALEEAL